MHSFSCVARRQWKGGHGGKQFTVPGDRTNRCREVRM